MRSLWMMVVVIGLLGGGVRAVGAILPELAPYKGPSRSDIDASTIRGKVMCGYQMWFRAPGDGVYDRWGHWSGQKTVTAENLTFEMWPDMSEYPASEKFKAEGLKHKDGSQAYLFSSIRPRVADLHFRWIREYGIDGVYVQRFLCGCSEPNTFRTTGTIALARNAAIRHGRPAGLLRRRDHRHRHGEEANRGYRNASIHASKDIRIIVGFNDPRRNGAAEPRRTRTPSRGTGRLPDNEAHFPAASRGRLHHARASASQCFRRSLLLVGSQECDLPSGLSGHEQAGDASGQLVGLPSL